MKSDCVKVRRSHEAKHPSLILASGSPRRRELLAMIAKDFQVVVSEVDEKTLEEKIFKTHLGSFEETVNILVKALSAEKARQVHLRYPEAMVIGADTIVIHKGAILGKPTDKEVAYNMIRSLAGKTHEVRTGVTICFKGKEDQFVSETKVRFLPWDEQMEGEVRAYVDQGLPMDKAGGYGIQEAAGLWVDWIKGDYFNVVGLPLAKLNKRMHLMMEASKNDVSAVD